MEIKPIIRIYYDFINDYQKINAWTEYDCFPIKDFVTYSSIDKYAVVEIVFTGTQGDNSRFDSIKNAFDSFFQKYLESKDTKNILLFKIGEIGIKRKLRSYKGILGKLNNSIEEEFDVKNGYSIIEGVINLNKENITLIKSFLFDRVKCFLLITEENMFSKRFLIEAYDSIINKPSYNVNYLKACIQYCDNDNIIVRESGDGGDQEFVWQLFVNKKNVKCIIEEIKKILGNYNYSKT